MCSRAERGINLMEAENGVVISSSQRRITNVKKKCFTYDVVEEILLRLPVKSLLPQLLGFSREHESLYFGFRKICLDSASFQAFNLLNFPQAKLSFEASDSCDGLVCMHGVRDASIYVVNPATRWFHSFLRVLMQKAKYTRETLSDIKPFTRLAFAKATSRDYKLVWLYNSDRYSFDASSPNLGFTKCEVFDFRAKAWRYVTCTLSYQIFDDHIDMCSLDNRLCMSKRKRQKMIQEIWILQSSAWEKIFSIDLRSCCKWSENAWHWFQLDSEGCGSSGDLQEQ